MTNRMPTEIRVAPYARNGDPVRHASGFSYKLTNLAARGGWLNNADRGWEIPNNTVHRVFVLAFNTTDYEFYKWDMATVLVIPNHEDPNTVLGFTAKVELSEVEKAIREGRLAEHGEILDHNLVFIAKSKTKIYLVPNDSNEAIEARQEEARQSSPVIRNKDLIPGHEYFDRNNNRLIYFGRTRSAAGRLQYVFYSAGRWQTQETAIEYIRTTSTLSYWNVKKSSSPKCIRHTGKVIEMTDELRNKVYSRQTWNNAERRYENISITFEDQLPSPRTSEASWSID